MAQNESISVSLQNLNSWLSELRFPGRFVYCMVTISFAATQCIINIEYLAAWKQRRQRR